MLMCILHIKIEHMNPSNPYYIDIIISFMNFVLHIISEFIVTAFGTQPAVIILIQHNVAGQKKTSYVHLAPEHEFTIKPKRRPE